MDLVLNNLKGFFCDVFQSRCYVPVDGIHAFKAGSLDDPLEVRNRKKPREARLDE